MQCGPENRGHPRSDPDFFSFFRPTRLDGNPDITPATSNPVSIDPLELSLLSSPSSSLVAPISRPILHLSTEAEAETPSRSSQPGPREMMQTCLPAHDKRTFRPVIFFFPSPSSPSSPLLDPRSPIPAPSSSFPPPPPPPHQLYQGSGPRSRGQASYLSVGDIRSVYPIGMDLANLRFRPAVAPRIACIRSVDR